MKLSCLNAELKKLMDSPWNTCVLDPVLGRSRDGKDSILLSPQTSSKVLWYSLGRVIQSPSGFLLPLSHLSYCSVSISGQDTIGSSRIHPDFWRTLFFLFAGLGFLTWRSDFESGWQSGRGRIILGESDDVFWLCFPLTIDSIDSGPEELHPHLP